MSADIAIQPPGDGDCSEEDSADEDDFDINRLSGNQLLAEADVRINYGDRISDTMDDDSQSESLGDALQTNSIQDDSIHRGRLSDEKPPLLTDLRWTNRDIKSRNSQSTPEVNHLEEIGTPLSLLELFFDDMLISGIVDFTLYARREKSDTEFGITKEKFRLFLAMLLMSGYHRLPDRRLYWSLSPDLFVAAMSDTMPRNEFERTLRNLHLCDNSNLDKSDKFSKLRPLITNLNEKFLKYSSNCETKSVDESMIPYYGSHGSKQRINNKPIRVGYKVWVLAEAYGYVIQFEPYQGAKTGRHISTTTTWGLGEHVVLNLMERLPPGQSYHVYMDNYFTSFRLLSYLGTRGISATGVINKKKLSKCDIMGNKDLEKKERGHVEQVTAEQDSTTITVVGWNDNRAVYIASNCLSSKPTRNVQRWSKIERKYIQVLQPNQFHCYNQCMGYVDRMDQNVAKYRIGIRMKKWWWAPFAWMLDVALQNSWILYRINKSCDSAQLSLLDFRREVVSSILLKYKTSRKRSYSSAAICNVPSEVRFDDVKHYQAPAQKQGRCKVCKTNSR